MSKGKKIQNNELDNKTLLEIKKGLLKRKKQILHDLKDISGNSQDGKGRRDKVKFPNFGDKTDENAQEVGVYSTNLVSEKVLESTLRDINNALGRIEDGTYGICKYCGEPISKKRLLARPVASACVKCKTKLQNAV